MTRDTYITAARQIIRNAHRVFVPVSSRDDVHYVQITKREALRLAEARGFDFDTREGDVYIERSN